MAEEWIEAEDWPTHDVRVLQGKPVRYSLEEVVEANRHYALGHTKQELLERGLREGVTIAPVNTVEDVARFRQREERGNSAKQSRLRRT